MVWNAQKTRLNGCVFYWKTPNKFESRLYKWYIIKFHRSLSAGFHNYTRMFIHNRHSIINHQCFWSLTPCPCFKQRPKFLFAPRIQDTSKFPKSGSGSGFVDLVGNTVSPSFDELVAGHHTGSTATSVFEIRSFHTETCGSKNVF